MFNSITNDSDKNENLYNYQFENNEKETHNLCWHASNKYKSFDE
jgi:hypothetical protein